MTSTADLPGHITWTRRLEEYFAATGEKAHVMSWAHTRAEALYSNRRTFIDLPVIALSSITGFLSVGSSSMFDDRELGNVSLGVLSLFVSVLNTMGSYFGWAKKTEAHRIAALHYAKLHRFIKVEMALPREERTAAHDFLKYVKEQYDRLNETSPALPEIIIKQFKEKFSKSDVHEISVPEQMNGLEPIHVYSDDDLRNDLNMEAVVKRLESEFGKSPDIASPLPRPGLRLGIVPAGGAPLVTVDPADGTDRPGEQSGPAAQQSGPAALAAPPAPAAPPAAPSTPASGGKRR